MQNKYLVINFLSFLFSLFFETGSLSVALTAMKLTLQTTLTSNSDICMPLPPECSIEGVHCVTLLGVTKESGTYNSCSCLYDITSVYGERGSAGMQAPTAG